MWRLVSICRCPSAGSLASNGGVQLPEPTDPPPLAPPDPELSPLEAGAGLGALGLAAVWKVAEAALLTAAPSALLAAAPTRATILAS